MATPIITPVPVYVDNVKVADATGGSIDWEGGRERVVTDGAVAFSNGRVIANAKINTIVPRKGMKARLIEAIVQQKIVKLRLPLDGKFQTVTGVLNQGSVQWQFANGMVSGDFSFLGGTPEIEG